MIPKVALHSRHQDLLLAELNQILGEPVTNITRSEYDGVWCNYIIHSYEHGTLKGIEIAPDFKRRYVRDEGYNLHPRDTVGPFTGANTSLGTLFLRTDTRDEMNEIISTIHDKIAIKLQ